MNKLLALSEIKEENCRKLYVFVQWKQNLVEIRNRLIYRHKSVHIQWLNSCNGKQWCILSGLYQQNKGTAALFRHQVPVGGHHFFVQLIVLSMYNNNNKNKI